MNNYLNTLLSEYPKTHCEALSFRGEPLLRDRHRIHAYPAMLHPLLVDHLIDTYVDHGRGVIFDPFCGSGVTLLQGIMHGHDVVGVDINPIALRISKAKTTKYDERIFRREFSDLRDKTRRETQFDIPPIRNIDNWYEPSIVADLGRIRHVLKSSIYNYSSFFTTCFAHVCRNQSFTRNGEFKRYRMDEVKRLSMKNEVLPMFISHTKSMMEVYLQGEVPNRTTRLELQDVEAGISNDIEADLILTSPPYGDSGTTVAYEQYTSFGFEWTNDLIPEFQANHDYYKLSLGNKKQHRHDLEEHGVLMDTIERIEKADPKRAMEVLRFFISYHRALTNILTCLKPGGSVCFVVGNRTVKNHRIPMDQITASFMVAMGLSFESISVREICNKVMPSRNSPTNVMGNTSKTMSSEYIVVCRKDT